MSAFAHAQQVVNVSVTLAAETVVATSDRLPVSQPGGEGISVGGVLNITAGTATTAVVLRVRQNSISGTVVGAAATHTLAATNSASIPYGVVDTAAATAPVTQYVVTAQQTAGTGNGTVNVGTIVLQQASSES